LKYDEFLSWENCVGDAEAEVLFLRRQPQVDPNRVGILGHSEGGLFALDAARMLKAGGHRPRVLILISTPGRSMDRVIADQLNYLLPRQGATPKQTDYFLSENARISQMIVKTGRIPPDVPPELTSLYPWYLGEFLQNDLALDPCKLAADFPGPVLVLAGSADVQVSPDRDAKALDAALASRKPDVHTLAIIPNASHNLKIPPNAADPGLDGPVAPAAMEQLRNWTAAHLTPP
jgi:hypothetical protein